jgi:2-hydroxy-3-keto-5-methylthiopentenyl-1-phosphate phosphatase
MSRSTAKRGVNPRGAISRQSLAVFCDYDGTFSIQDVGSTLARRHLGDRRLELWDRYESGEYTAWQYNRALLDGFHLPEAELEAFLQTVELDPGARRLLAWCTELGVPFRILSDGFDYNLDRLQVIHGVAFAYTANILHYEGDEWRITAGFPNPECECGTGVCKRLVIDTYRAANPGAFCVHIGNGRVSDLCGALAADLVFAKESLAEALDERAAIYSRFDTLGDVVDALAILTAELAPDASQPSISLR